MPIARKRSNPPKLTARPRPKKPRYQESPSLSPEPDDSIQESEELINEEDICSICALLLVKPVTTNCNHTFCEDCFKIWADVSLTDRIEHINLDEDFAPRPQVIEAKCPMCRTLSLGMLTEERAEVLADLYPRTYATRLTDVNAGIEDDEGALIEPIQILIGNEHQLVRVEDDQTQNKHAWRFFVKVSRSDIVEEVHIFLHPTFRDYHVILTYAPFAIRRVGWGTFDIHAFIVLKAGYSWVSSDAEDTPDGAVKGRLPLSWRLDFGGRGSQGRLRLKVRKQKDGQEEEDVRLMERNRRAWMRQRDRDPDYVPPDED